MNELNDFLSKCPIPVTENKLACRLNMTRTRAKGKLDQLFANQNIDEEILATIESHVDMPNQDFETLRTTVKELSLLLDHNKPADEKKEESYLETVNKAREIFAFYQGKAIVLKRRICSRKWFIIGQIFPRQRVRTPQTTKR